ncbi:hypothetical protein Drose_26355 [Dactylosporangium roseum]|uniref:Lipoprotein n=1 Tax=Dactylosporangium roseum TaxID=47989 RepID=A0ABY5YZT5_9ACTN|nr:hypothetical protein [Dactylosporangium roseum]UWZ34717.1 hypothetical protein Drose_26355 [Dactylosporangium roseum]
MTWRRLVVIMVAVALVAVGGGGAAGYFGGGNAAKAKYVASCGGAGCIPTLQGKKVVDALTGKGFACKEEHNWECKFVAGENEYTVFVQIRDGLISEVQGWSRSADEQEVSPARKAFLLWFAALPFNNDQTTVSEIENWLVPLLTGGKNAEVVIGGYIYELTAERSRNLQLRIRGDSS